MADLPAFVDHMHDALDACRAATHFEDGGCWGMALALQSALADDGVSASLAIQDGFCHAMVRVGDVLVDHTGTMPRHVRANAVDRATFDLARGAACMSEDDVEADRAWAADVVAVAREIAARAVNVP